MYICVCRIISNRVSAQKSRMKKLQYVSEMENKVKTLEVNKNNHAFFSQYLLPSLCLSLGIYATHIIYIYIYYCNQHS